MNGFDVRVSRRRFLWATAGIMSAGHLDALAQQPQKTHRFHRSSGPVILGYYPDWTAVAPQQLDLTLFSHICHAFASFEHGAGLSFPDDAQTHALISACAAHDTCVLLSVGGADSNGPLSKQDTDVLADALVKRIQDFGYDGVDVDWEGHESEDDAAKMSMLVKALRLRLPHAILTMATSATDWGGKWFHTPDLKPYIDWLNIMTYDFAGPWSDTAGHNAPMPEMTKSIDYWIGKGFRADQLTLGIPDYGRRMKAKRFGDPAPKGTYYPDEIAYKDISGFIDKGWKPIIDPDAQVPYLVSPDGAELITYEDTRSARAKGKLAHDRSLRGFFFWEITSDFDGRTHVLAQAARQGWDSKA